MTITPGTLMAVLSYLAGLATTFLGAYNAGNWTSLEQAVVTAIGGSIAIVTHHQVTKKTVSKTP